jgi:hypothetical protein
LALQGVSIGADTGTLKVPQVVAVGDTKNGSFLITEHLQFGGRADQAELGYQLAMMHKATPKVCPSTALTDQSPSSLLPLPLLLHHEVKCVASFMAHI